MATQEYTSYDQREHVYKKPEMYIGSTEQIQRPAYAYDFQTKHMKEVITEWPTAAQHMFVEVIANAHDNVIRSVNQNIPPGQIEIKMDSSTISVKNYGRPISTQTHSDKGIPIPQLIFGVFLTSSNYDTTRKGAGQNGLGIKVVVVFSTTFTVIIHNPQENIKYTQTWTDNMKVCNPPIIEHYTGSESSTEIIYSTDFQRFGYSNNSFPNEVFEIYARLAADLSFTCKVPVLFNDITSTSTETNRIAEFNLSYIKDYSSLYHGKVQSFTHYQWPPDTKISTKKSGEQTGTFAAINELTHKRKSKATKVYPEVELIVLDTAVGSVISFVNGTETDLGGPHVNAALKAITDGIVKEVNSASIGPKINVRNVKNYLSLIISFNTDDPAFLGQTKSSVSDRKKNPFKITIPAESIKAISKWDVMDRLRDEVERKVFESDKKTGRSHIGKRVADTRGIDANNASSKNYKERSKCTLYVTEGNMSYVEVLISLYPIKGRGRDFIGTLPLKGKSLNVMTVSEARKRANKEIERIMAFLGLRWGVDYSEEENYKTLRYGKLMILADSDTDGKHIIGLVLNLFHVCFPALLERRFVSFYRTYTIKVSKGKSKYRFYTQYEYEQWAAGINTKDWSHYYAKGLGSSSEEDIKQDMVKPRIVSCLYDEKACESMNLAFHPKFSDLRKEWIRTANPDYTAETLIEQPITSFINNELIQFSIADIYRSIPGFMDGLKPSQRKVIFSSYLHWGNISKSSKYKPFKVQNFSAFVGTSTSYKHGGSSLDGVIIKMTQDFTGSNNIPWFHGDGMFGTRMAGGADAAAPRYPSVEPHKLLGFLFRQEDFPILRRLEDEGSLIECETFYPIVPMALVNGANGVGTAYRTYIPNYHLLDLIKWLKIRIMRDRGERGFYPRLIPWYRGFTGDIEVINRTTSEDDEAPTPPEFRNDNIVQDGDQNENEVPDENTFEHSETSNRSSETPTTPLSTSSKLRQANKSHSAPIQYSMVTTGRFKILDNNAVKITELPIGRWTRSYNDWITSQEKAQKISHYLINSVKNVVDFTIFGMKDEPSIKSLYLRKREGISNMVLLMDNNVPVTYRTPESILDAFYIRRLPIYQVRKDYLINKLTENLNKLISKITVIKMLLDGGVISIGMTKTKILEELAKINIDKETFNKISVTNCTKEEVAELEEKIRKLQEELDELTKMQIHDMWLKELSELEEEYVKIYGDDRKQ